MDTPLFPAMSNRASWPYDCGVLRAAGVLVFTPAANDRRVRLVRIAPKVLNTLKRQVG